MNDARHKLLPNDQILHLEYRFRQCKGLQSQSFKTL